MEESAYAFIHQSEKNHWWFVGRRSVVSFFLKKIAKGFLLDTLDVGSGYGAMIPLLLTYSQNVDCIEPWEDARLSLKQFGVRTIFDIQNFPDSFPQTHYDLVTLFDVLEHIREHDKAIEVIRNKILRQNGRIMITVPANQWLWSKHDEIHHHFRRYSKRSIVFLLKEKGFKKIRASYFMTFLFPMVVYQRLFMKRYTMVNDFQTIHPIANWLLKVIFSCESLLIRFIPFPFGLSVIAIAEK